MPQLRAALLREGGANIMIVVGGVIPLHDFDSLREAGVAAIFPPGTAISEAAARLIGELNDRLGYRQKDVAGEGTATARIIFFCAETNARPKAKWQGQRTSRAHSGPLEE